MEGLRDPKGGGGMKYISTAALGDTLENLKERKIVSYAELVSEIAAIPAADVRPVVLCRDCKYSYDSVGGWCCSHGICVDCIVREDFFCADGEKREES
jgi:hypothetical protein